MLFKNYEIQIYAAKVPLMRYSFYSKQIIAFPVLKWTEPYQLHNHFTLKATLRRVKEKRRWAEHISAYNHLCCPNYSLFFCRMAVSISRVCFVNCIRLAANPVCNCKPIVEYVFPCNCYWFSWHRESERHKIVSFSRKINLKSGFFLLYACVIARISRCTLSAL